MSSSIRGISIYKSELGSSKQGLVLTSINFILKGSPGTIMKSYPTNSKVCL